MTPQALQYVNDRLTEADINYHFARYHYEGDAPVYPYSVGTYSEADPESEDGRQRTTITVSSWTRGTWLELEQVKAKIRTMFPPVEGATAILPGGSGVAINYLRALPIPTGDGELKRMDIIINLTEWSE